MTNTFWSIVLNDLRALIAKIEPIVEAVGNEIIHIFAAVFAAEEQALMTELYTLLKQAAVDLQNTTPGMAAKDFMAELSGQAVTILAGMGKTLALTAITATVATVCHDLGVQDNGGNAGNVTSSAT